jgi:AraC-like DNA-binding protein
MCDYNIQNMALLGVEIEHIVLDGNNISSVNARSHCAVGCIISGSCRMLHNGQMRIISERELYVIDNEIQNIECFANNGGKFEQIILHINMSNNTSESAVTHRERERFDSAILQGIVANLSIEELADKCCYSVSTFKRRFRERYSASPHKWFLSCRLDIAAMILRHADIPTRYIAALCGFVNVSHFIATFKRRFGTTPSRISKR